MVPCPFTLAAHYFDVTQVNFYDFEDGMLTSYPEVVVREKVTVAVRSFKPHIVLTFFPYPDFSAPPLKAQCPNCWDDFGYHTDHQV